MAHLPELADVMRSKAVGPYKFTLDIIFKDHKTYDRALRTGVFTKQSIAVLYGTIPDRITDLVFFRPGRAVKITMLRMQPAGAFGDGDVLASQQNGPLHRLLVPIEEIPEEPVPKAEM